MGHADQTVELSRLLRLTIDGVGLIAHAEVDFADGCTAFTGETGSGKTMLLGALELALGGRADRDLVRGERARVALELSPGAELRARLRDAGIALDTDDDVVIVRELSAGGRSAARINGVPVSASQLRELGDAVVERVGQGEAGRLLDPVYARELLDRFAGPRALALGETLRAGVARRAALAAERDALGDEGERARAARADAREALSEIDAAAIADDAEDERLRERREVLGNAERIAAALATARAALEDENGAVDALGTAMHALAGLTRYGPAFGELETAAALLQSDAGALAAAVARAADDVERDPSELDAVVARLETLDRLKRRFGGSLAAVRLARERFAAAVEADAGRDERQALLERELQALDARLATASEELRALRAAAARGCEAAVAEELRALAMPAARFAVALEPRPLGPRGTDRVEFRFSANPGEIERPLARVASGGERSRLLLALIVVLAGVGERTFVFDEVDAGIGGATAVAVGGRLGRLARAAQVVCVTHLAQIAVWADAHYALRKEEREATTVIAVDALPDREARLAEIARMLSGTVTPLALEHAAALASERGAVPTAQPQGPLLR